MSNYILNWNSFADAIDRLIVCVSALSWFENKKREESLKSEPNAELIMKWDRLSRDRCEERDLLKREINRILGEMADRTRAYPYEVVSPGRTFAPSSRTVADIIAEAIPMAWKDEAVKELETLFKE